MSFIVKNVSEVPIPIPEVGYTLEPDTQVDLMGDKVPVPYQDVHALKRATNGSLNNALAVALKQGRLVRVPGEKPVKRAS